MPPISFPPPRPLHIRPGVSSLPTPTPSNLSPPYPIGPPIPLFAPPKPSFCPHFPPMPLFAPSIPPFAYPCPICPPITPFLPPSPPPSQLPTKTHPCWGAAGGLGGAGKALQCAGGAAAQGLVPDLGRGEGGQQLCQDAPN